MIVQQPEKAGRAIHTLFVSDFDDIIKQIANRGLEPTKQETLTNGVRKTTYRDPEGNEISFGGSA